jgi:hypothetical protein
MSNEGDIHILHRQSAINYCVNKILNYYLCENLQHKFICVCMIAHIKKVKRLN